MLVAGQANTSWLMSNCEIPSVNSAAPNGHTREKIKLTVTCWLTVQPLACIRLVIDIASSGLCRKIARKTPKPTHIECSAIVAAAKATPSISV